jgi:hypothetical protein
VAADTSATDATATSFRIFSSPGANYGVQRTDTESVSTGHEASSKLYRTVYSRCAGGGGCLLHTLEDILVLGRVLQGAAQYYRVQHSTGSETSSITLRL